MNRLTLAFFTILFLFTPLPARGHGASSEQLKRLTEQIKQTPNNVDLYLRRGDLYRQLGNAKAALEDFETVQRLAPDRCEVDLYRARLYLDANIPEMALIALDRLLKLRPQQTEAILLRAQAHTKLGARALAIQDYTAALARLANPRPEVFVARAQLQIEARQYDAAVNGLDEGIAKLGSLIALQLLAIEIEVQQKRWDAAIARLDIVTAQIPRKESWLVRRAEIQLQAGRKDDARQSLDAAQALIAALPDHLRKAPAIESLSTNAAQLLKRASDVK